MNLQAPRNGQIVGLALFLLACVGLTIYLWLTFGGTSPLEPRPYRITVPMADASGLAPQSDVRISGVDVGKVTAKRLDAAHHRTLVQIDLDAAYAPRPADTRAAVRQKTLLGESYVALTPGTPTAPKLPDGGTLPAGQVERSTHLDDVLRTFDAPTRRALATWLTGQGAVLGDGGPALSAALAQLAPLGRYGGDTLAVLHEQDPALAVLLRDGGASLQALTARRGQLRALTADASRVFGAAAAQDRALAATFAELPSFLRASRATVQQAARFSTKATPLVRQLRPAAVQLGPVVAHLDRLAPDLRELLTALGPLTSAADRGLPALQGVLADITPLLARLKPYLGTLIPAVDYLSGYKHELTALFANIAATTQATLPAADDSGPLHYARAAVPINPESLTAYPVRLSSNRSNPYPRPGDYLGLLHGLQTVRADVCTTQALPTLSADLPADLRQQIQDFYFTDDPSGPPCLAQAPLAGAAGSYPHLHALP